MEMEFGKIIEAVLAGASIPLMFGVAFVAALLRWAHWVPKRVGIILSLVLGGLIGLLIATGKPIPEGSSPAEVYLGAFLFNGIASTWIGRLVYPAVLAGFGGPDDPTEAEQKPPTP